LKAGIYASGASIGFFAGDIRQLTDDFAELKPTVAAVVPRVLNRVYAAVSALDFLIVFILQLTNTCRLYNKLVLDLRSAC
jgi:hypothetical protein